MSKKWSQPALPLAAISLAALLITGCGSGTAVLGQASQQELNDATEIDANGTTFQVEKAKGNYSGTAEQQLIKCFRDWNIKLPGTPTAQERRWQTTKAYVPGFSDRYFVGIAKSKGTTYAYVWLTKSESAADELAKRINQSAQKVDPGYQTSGLMTVYAEAEPVGQVVRTIPTWTNASFGKDAYAWNGCALRLRG